MTSNSSEVCVLCGKTKEEHFRIKDTAYDLGLQDRLRCYKYGIREFTPQKTNSHPEIKLGNSGGNSAKEQSSPDKRTKLDDTNTQTPPTLKDKIIENKYGQLILKDVIFADDVKESLKRLRDEIELSDINGSIFVLNKIDEIMGVFE